MQNGKIIEEKEVNIQNLQEEKVKKNINKFFRKAKTTSTNVFSNKSEAEKSYMNMQEKEKTLK